ncbi:MAG TPA: ferredoxin-thioredoxin reductase [Sulfurovum sp. UBA12169]|nr:MAG TPA: ferredoxin-thioredoxin reductase [Sulfurovum sp. UBA12169]
MQQLDMNSEEFKAELEKTERFADKVCESRGWSYGPNADVNEGVIMGLARHKLLYGKRFCPCYMVEEDESRPGKFKSADDRICPCKPAIEKEIPQEGICHCQIFCTPEYFEAHKK